MTDALIHALQAQFSGIERLDIESKEYQDLRSLLNKADDATLKLLAGASIKFVSKMALNRCVSRGLVSKI